MYFRRYPKIHRLGKEETDGILNHPVTIQEKVDGANVSLYLRENKLQLASRNRVLPEDEGFQGFREAVENGCEHLVDYLLKNPYHYIYGEWLVKHTVSYPEEAYKKLYLFDIYDAEHNIELPQDLVAELAAEGEVTGFPHIFESGQRMSREEIEEYVGKSMIGPQGEGVVIKAPDFRNTFGQRCHAKLVTQKFLEENSLTWGSNNKHSETYQEMRIVNKYVTEARVRKIVQKLQPEIEEQLDKKHTTRVAHTCYHDMIEEEGWEIAKTNATIDFKALKTLSTKKFVILYHNILEEIERVR